MGLFSRTNFAGNMMQVSPHCVSVVEFWTVVNIGTQFAVSMTQFEQNTKTFSPSGTNSRFASSCRAWFLPILGKNCYGKLIKLCPIWPISMNSNQRVVPGICLLTALAMHSPTQPIHWQPGPWFGPNMEQSHVDTYQASNKPFFVLKRWP